MTFKQFLTIIFARYRLFLSILLTCVVVVLVGSLLVPKKYTATSSVVVDVKQDPVSAMALQSMVPPTLIATQIDIIQSERVARRVVRNLKLAENPQIRQQWENERPGNGADIETWLVTVFQRELDVKPSRESSVINVSYSGREPRFAAGVANAFVQAYLETSLELRTEPAKRFSSFFDERVKEAREKLEKAQSSVSAFQSQKGIIASDERLDIENQRLNELSSQLVMLQALSAESGSRQSQANGSSADRIQEVLNNPLISGLKADLARSEARLQELSARLGDSHPQVKEIKANIVETRLKIEQETKRVTGGVTVSNSINKQREAEVRAALDTQRNKVLQLKAVRDDGAVLMREVENAQRSYDAVLSRLTQSSLESQVTSSNVNLLNEATVPLDPSSPKVFLNTALSVFLGLFLAIGIVLVLELRDRRIRAVDDVTALLGLPVLGVLPAGDRRSAGLWKRKVLTREQRLLGNMPTANKVA
jgi:polysaccharide biosynthesis transport protein